MHKDIISDSFNMGDAVPSLKGKDKEEFLNFVQKLLQWLPERGKSAKELLEDPWLCPDLI